MLSQADSPLVVSQSVSQLGASNIPHTQPETPHSSLLASQVSLSQLGMRSPLGVSQITLSQADTNCSTMIAPMALLSQPGTSPSPLLAHPQASCSVLPTESHREAEESTEPTTIAHTPSHTESAQSSESNKRHITKLSNATSHKQKRRRTRYESTEKASPTKHVIKSVSSNWEPPSISKFTIQDFKTNEREQKAMNNLLQHALSYMLYKSLVQQTEPEKTGKCFQTFLEASSKPTTEQESSNVIYMDILDEYADNKDTILNTLALLQERLEIGTTSNYLGVVGDGKTYDHLHSLKVEYGEELNWLIPLPGDWHILKNYQEVLMKVYFDGGLRDAAKQAGYSEGSLNSIGACGKFKRTNDFILKAWESVLRIFLSEFVANSENGKMVAEQIKEVLSTHSTDEEPDVSSLFKLMVHLCEDEGKLTSEFQQYLTNLSAQDDTCKLWRKFVLEDCLPYIGLYIAMRSGNWNLRMYSIKEMAALFSAYDRITYQRLIPRHIAKLLRAPPELLSHLQDGGFVASLSGDCMINKQYKTVIFDHCLISYLYRNVYA